MQVRTFIEYYKWYESRSLPFWYQCIMSVYVALAFRIIANEASMWADNKAIPAIKAQFGQPINDEQEKVFYHGRRPKKDAAE